MSTDPFFSRSFPASPDPTMALPSISSLDIPKPGSWRPDTAAGARTLGKQPQSSSFFMSPPDTHLQDFSAEHLASPPFARPNPALTPPFSPQEYHGSDKAVHRTPGGKDPILYPASGSSPASAHEPLFGDPKMRRNAKEVKDKMAISTLIDQHAQKRNDNIFVAHNVQPPKDDEYDLIINLAGNVMLQYMKDPRGLLRANRQQIEYDNRARRMEAPARVQSRASRPRLLPAARIEQAQAPARPYAGSRSGAGRSFINGASRANTSGAKSAARKAIPKTDDRIVEGRVNKRATPTERRQAPVTREDKNYEHVVDYCPPLSSIPARPGCLKSEWKGSPIDLSTDKLRHLLHKEELDLAGSLRLDCATYLTSKRRIFLKRVECYEKSKEFRKTDAQQACNIDVNKASRLHSAYEGIGWLDAKWIIHFVQERKKQRAAHPPTPGQEMVN